MNFEVYCDESGPEAFAKKEAHKYAAIGGIWIESKNRERLKSEMYEIKEKYNIKGELKWKKISPSYFELYKEVIDYFFNSDYIRFRVILVEANKIDHIKFNKQDSELGFYKFYYQLLNHWIFDFNKYDIFLDYKVNRNKNRLKELNKILQFSNLTSVINQVQALPSEQSLGIQLADIITGLTAAKFNKEIYSKAKLDLIEYIESKYLQRPICPTPKWEEKLNIFRINLNGGW